MMVMRSSDIATTNTLARTFVEHLMPRARGATIVGLRGDLGAGKTTFVQAVADVLGVDEHVTSPTFVIEKVYALDHPTFRRLIHIDAYRLTSGEELRALGWEQMSADPGNLILLEWPERVADALPEETPIIKFTFIDEHTREIHFPYDQEN
jgi:tRNA threonylcarbamoyladenosine biosynthesis protein TsaE